GHCDRYMEIYNLVFMEYDLKPGNVLEPLPNQNVDTGLGLERTACVLQGVESVFDTDGFRLIMDWVAAESGVGYHDSEVSQRAHRARRGGAVLRDARARDEVVRRARQPGRDQRRGRIQADRDLRLPDRADAGARGGARPGGRRRRLPRADGGPPRDLARRRRELEPATCRADCRRRLHGEQVRRL